jgi:hypothetical protein
MATLTSRPESADSVMEQETDDLTDEQIERLRKRLHDRAINELNFSEEDAKLFSDVFADASRTERSEETR